ncbi:MAG: hypothetical protein WCX73_05435 [Candidatus Pacearchaeota archaeon]|jgi:hypothetical protein
MVNKKKKSGEFEEEVKKEITSSKEPSVKQKQNRQVIWALILMVCVIAIIFLVPYIKQNFFNKFEYISLDFYKTTTDGINFYYTEIPLVNVYNFPIGEYSIYFRNDPRNLANVSVDIIENKIQFQKNNSVYISIQSDAPICDDNIVSIVGLTSFLDKFGNLTVKGAMSDALYSSDNNLAYVTCETNPNNTVLLFKTGNETKISKTGKNCYELIYKDCEINRATEKFILTIMESYMNKYNELDLK